MSAPVQGRSSRHAGTHWPVYLHCRTQGDCDDLARCVGCMLRQAYEEGFAVAIGIIALGEWARRCSTETMFTGPGYHSRVDLDA